MPLSPTFLLSGGCKSAGARPSPFSFTFFFFPQLPTLFPPGKGPFASLARVSILHPLFNAFKPNIFY
jgi:hypothetical protein